MFELKKTIDAILCWKKLNSEISDRILILILKKKVKNYFFMQKKLKNKRQFI